MMDKIQAEINRGKLAILLAHVEKQIKSNETRIAKRRNLGVENLEEYADGMESVNNDLKFVQQWLAEIVGGGDAE